MTSVNERPKTSGNETELLATEAAAARAAVLQVIGDLKSGLSTAADPRLWARQHPWAAVGVAAVAGFAAAALVVPSQDKKLKEKLADIFDAVSPRDKAESNGDAKVDPRSGPGPMAMAMGPLIDLAKTALTSLVVGAVHQSSSPPEAETATAAAMPDTESDAVANREAETEAPLHNERF
jgi:hypothetical protein